MTSNVLCIRIVSFHSFLKFQFEITALLNLVRTSGLDHQAYVPVHKSSLNNNNYNNNNNRKVDSEQIKNYIITEDSSEIEINNMKIEINEVIIIMSKIQLTRK